MTRKKPPRSSAALPPGMSPELSERMAKQGVEVYLQLQRWLESHHGELDGRVLLYAISLELGAVIGASSAALGMSEGQIETLVAFVISTVRAEVAAVRKEITQ